MKRTSEKVGFEVKKSKWFWAYWVLAAVAAVLGVFLLPVWGNTKVFWKSWATDGISLMTFVCVVVYTAYLGCGIKKSNPRAKNMLCVAEVAVLVVIAVLCLLQQCKLFDVIGPSFVVGAILWLRGVVCILSAYLFNVRKEERTLGIILCSLLAITLGVALMVRKITAPVFIWTISIGLLVVAVVAVIFGILAMPEKADKKV